MSDVVPHHIDATHGAVAPVRQRHVPATRPIGFVKGDDESVAVSLHRISSEQFARAIDALCDTDRPLHEAVPTAVDAIGRVRSILRLVRNQLGDESYNTENEALRDTQAELATFVAGRDPVVALDGIAARYAAQLQADALADLRVRLVQRAQIQRLTAHAEAGDGSEIVQRIRRAKARFESWPLDTDDISMPGRDPVADEFDAIAPGLEDTYRRGRRRLKRCTEQPKATHFASWGRETRVLGHQMEVLTSIWPEVLSGMARSLGQITEILVEEQQLAHLLVAIHGPTHLCPDDAVRSLVSAIGQHERRELHDIARALGQRVYVEKSSRFLSRLRGYWGPIAPEFELDLR